MKKNKYLLSPDINNPNLTKTIKGYDQKNNEIDVKVIKEKSLTIFLNKVGFIYLGL